MEQARGENPSGLTRSSQTILAFAAVTGLLYYDQPVLVPFVLAVFIFAMFSSTLDWLVLRLRFPRSLALTVSFCLVLIVTLLVFLIVGEAIRRVVVTATSYSDSLSNMADRIFTRATRAGVKMDPEVLLGDVRGAISAIAAGVAGRGLDAISTFVLVLILLFFLMAGRDPRAIRTGVYASIDREVRCDLILKALLSAILGVAQGGVLWLFGVELATVFGPLAIGFWGLVWGLIDAFLAVPLTAIIRLISLRIDALRPLGRLLGGRIPEIDKPAIA